MTRWHEHVYRGQQEQEWMKMKQERKYLQGQSGQVRDPCYDTAYHIRASSNLWFQLGTRKYDNIKSAGYCQQHPLYNAGEHLSAWTGITWSSSCFPSYRYFISAFILPQCLPSPMTSDAYGFMRLAQSVSYIRIIHHGRAWKSSNSVLGEHFRTYWDVSSVVYSDG